MDVHKTIPTRMNISGNPIPQEGHLNDLPTLNHCKNKKGCIMFKPKYLVQLDEKAFSDDTAVCLGAQLKSIVETLSGFMASCVWFGADVDAISHIPEQLGIDTVQLRKIGDRHALMSLCEHIDQFLSGAFIAVQARSQNFKCSASHVGTEDAQFRYLAIDGILVEIRAFDTSYFEVYTDNPLLIKKFIEQL